MASRPAGVDMGERRTQTTAGTELTDGDGERLLDRLVDDLADNRARPPAPRAPITAVGLCVDDRHPSLPGRVRVQVESGGHVTQAWIPSLAHLVVRTGDRVLVQGVENWPEPIVTGVLDGYAPVETPAAREAATLSLRADECVTIRDDRDRPLLEIRCGAQGPELRLAQPDVALEVPGKLTMRAGAIKLESTIGDVEIDAVGDVRVRGELIELN